VRERLRDPAHGHALLQELEVRAVSPEVGQERLVTVGAIAEELGGQPELQPHAFDAVPAPVHGDVVPPRAGSLAFPTILTARYFHRADLESDAVKAVAGEVLPGRCEPLRGGHTGQVRQRFGNSVHVAASLDEDVDITHRQVNALQASRCRAEEPVLEPRSDSPDQVEAGAQHPVQSWRSRSGRVSIPSMVDRMPAGSDIARSR
jgi:hypothetical protein